MSRLRPIAVTGLLTVIVAGCAAGATAPASVDAPARLTIYGAASLTAALDKVKPAWERSHQGSPLTISTDSSAALATQIEQGAPADVFLSADTSNPGRLVDKGLADGAAVTYAGNGLTIVVPASNPAGIETPADLARPGVKIIAAADDVPITKYAMQAVANLGRLGDYPASFGAGYAANVVSREDNVRRLSPKSSWAKATPRSSMRPTRGRRRSSRRSPFRPRPTSLPRMPEWSSRPPSTPRRRTSSSIGSPNPKARRSSARSASFHRIDVTRALAVLVALFLGLPVALLVARAVFGGSLAAALLSGPVRDALLLSLGTTAISLGLTIVIATPLAHLLARRRFRGAAVVEAIVDLPIVLPPSVAGLALLLTLGRRGAFGDQLAALGLAIPFTTVAVVLAQMFVSAPFFIRAARTGFLGVGRDHEDAARVDGASERQVAWAITLPLAAPALASGIVMTWARALGEFGATIMFAGNIGGRTQTLPLVVYGEFQAGDLEASIAAAAILVLAAFGVLLAVRGLRWGRALDLRAA